MKAAEESGHVASLLRQAPTAEARLRIVLAVQSRIEAVVRPVADALIGPHAALADPEVASFLYGARGRESVLPTQRAAIGVMRCCSAIVERGDVTDSLRDWLLLEFAAMDEANDREQKQNAALRANDIPPEEEAEIRSAIASHLRDNPGDKYEIAAIAIANAHNKRTGKRRAVRTIRSFFPVGTRGRPPKIN